MVELSPTFTVEQLAKRTLSEVSQRLDDADAACIELKQALDELFQIGEAALLQAESAASILADTPMRLRKVALDGLAEGIGDAPERLSRAMSDFGAAVAGLLSGADGREALNAAIYATDEASSNVEEVTNTAIEAALLAAETVRDELDDYSQSARLAGERLDAKVGALLDDMRDMLAEDVVAPFEAESERLVDLWRGIVETEMTTALDAAFEDIRSKIDEPLTAAMAALEDAARREIEALRQSLVTGDDEGATSRAQIEAATELLQDAKEPLEAAFAAFRGLAGAVGVKL
jgi:hypothetical protein